MRNSTALVPVRNKSTPVLNRAQAVYHLGCQPEVPIARDFEFSSITNNQLIPDMSISKINDAYLIQEVSKNYILIPKLRSQFMNNYIQQTTPVHNTNILPHMQGIPNSQGIQSTNTPKTISVTPNSNENNDWTSKYEILNILKNEEKEKNEEKRIVSFSDNNKTKPIFTKEDNLPNNIYENVSQPHSSTGIIVANQSEVEHKYVNELPEKDIPVERVNYEEDINDEINVNTVMQDNLVPHLPTENNSTNEVPLDTVADSCQLQENIIDNYAQAYDVNVPNENANYIEPTNSNFVAEQTHYPIHDETAIPEANYEQQNEQNSYVGNVGEFEEEPSAEVEFKSNYAENVEYTDEGDTYPPQVLSSNDLVANINNVLNVPNENQSGIESADQDVYVEDLAPNVDLHMKMSLSDISSDNQEPKQTNYDATQEQMPETENPLDIQDNTEGIEAFNTEQEMFYTNNPYANYEYQQDQVNPDSALQNQGYEQEYQNYAYYQNDQQNPNEIGDAEENVRYDQTYQQQYVDQYGQEYQNQEPPQPEGTEQPVFYEQIPDEHFEQMIPNEQQEVMEVLQPENKPQVTENEAELADEMTTEPLK